MAKRATDNNKLVYFIVHRKELCNQIENTFTSYGVNMDYCKIFMVQTLTRRLDKVDVPDLLLVDECFPGNTKISTKNGTKLLKNIQHGDIITSYNHCKNKIEYKKVIHLFKNKANDCIKINLSNGKSIFCTKNHPFYKLNGGYYEKAGLLKRNDSLLYSMQKRNELGGYDKRTKSNISQEQNRKSLLLKGVHQGIYTNIIKQNNGKNKQKICKRQDERKQSHEKPRNKRKSIKEVKGNWSFTKDKVWKWCRTNGTTTKFINSIKRIRALCRICYTDFKGSQKWNLSKLLQGGYCNPTTSNSCRSRWGEPQYDRKEISRQEKRRALNVVRVESIEIQKQTSDGTFGGLCEGGYVYNIEVEDNNNYFAEGVLVHNCHHSTSLSYVKIFNYFKCYKIGVTATPIRLSGEGFEDINDILIQSVYTEWLIENGYLSPAKIFSAPLFDVKNIKTKAGDYDVKQSAEELDKSIIYGDIIKTWRDKANNKKTIIYCSTVKHAENTALNFNEAGITARNIDGTTNSKLRDEIIEQFRNGEITVLTNCDIVSEGFDIADCECVILLRPTKSLTLFIQQSMRCMRYKEGKQAVILDHVANTFRHGLPWESREWSLKGAKKNKKDKDKLADSIHTCEFCFCSWDKKAGRICPMCGEEMIVANSEIKEDDTVELIEIKKEMFKKAPYSTHEEITNFEDMCIFQKAKGYKFGWTIRKCHEQGIEIPAKYKYQASKFYGIHI